MLRTLKQTMMASFAIVAMFAVQSMAQAAGEYEAEKQTHSSEHPAMGMDCCSAAEGAGLICGVCNPKAKAEVGKPAIDFSLKDAEGETRKLSDYKGENVVLVWENPKCPVSKRLMQEGAVNKLAENYKAKNVAIVAIDSSNYVTSESTKEAEKEYGLTYPTLLDPEGEIGRAYGARTTPHVFVVDSKGALAYAGAIDNDPRGKIAAAERVNHVAQALDELLAGEAVSTPETKPYGCSVKYVRTE